VLSIIAVATAAEAWIVILLVRNDSVVAPFGTPANII